MRPRRGIALLMALCTLALVGALIATTLHTVGELRRGASRLGTIERARMTAERAMMLALAQAPESLAAGSSVEVALDDASLRRAPDESVTARVTALPGGVRRFVVTARAGFGSRMAEQGLSALAARAPPRVRVPAAVASGSTIEIAAGWDVRPDSSHCVLPGDGSLPEPLPLVQLPSLSDLQWAEAPEGAAQAGSPGAEQLVVPLAPRASVRISTGAVLHPAPREVAGQCFAEASNWGSSTGACAQHWPIVLAEGDLQLSGGEGQGVLLVRGDLSITGPFSYSGLIVSLGDITLEADSLRLHSAIIAAGSLHLTESGILVGSACSVMEALAGAARWELVPAWGWGAIR